MLVRDVKRLLLVVAPIATLFVVGGRLFWRTSYVSPTDRISNGPSSGGLKLAGHDGSSPDLPMPYDAPAPEDQHELVSLTTPTGKYFHVIFNTVNPDQMALNPNFLPHPTLSDTWIVVAQKRDPDGSQENAFVWVSVEFSCNARFNADGTALVCVTPPLDVPILPTKGDLCTGEQGYFALNQGPHDARVFYGPVAPYAVYGSNGQVTTCFGIWTQDFRALNPEAREPASRGFLSHIFGGSIPPPDPSTPFQVGTELSRPPPYGAVEKNWFMFWDMDGEAYLHHDIMPRRTFARLHGDGTTGPDLAPAAASSKGGHDAACLARYLPKHRPGTEDAETSIHQATNSLSVTLCRRADAGCAPTANNTVVISIVQRKRMEGFMHAEYEPHVVAFSRAAPFALHGISRAPLWLRGRRAYPDDRKSEMIYVTSMAWKRHGLKYHGFLDDVVLLGFGIEDRRPGGIDVTAEELLSGLGLCSELSGSGGA